MHEIVRRPCDDRVVACPAEIALHIGCDEIIFAVDAASYVRIACAARAESLLYDGLVVIERREVVAVFAQCKAYGFVLGIVAAEIDEQITAFFRMYGFCVIYVTQRIENNGHGYCRRKQDQHDAGRDYLQSFVHKHTSSIIVK